MQSARNLGAVDGQEKVWLVRSANKIVGPLSFQDLIQALQAKEVRIHDECRTPRSRWKMISEEPLLVEAIKKIANDLGGELEVPTQRETKTLTASETVDIKSHSGGEPAPPTDRAVREVTHLGLEDILNDNAKSGETPSYGYNQDPALQNQMQGKSRHWIWITLVLILIAGAFTFKTLRERGVLHSGEDFDSWADKGHKAYELGKLREALSFYKRAQSFAQNHKHISREQLAQLHLALAPLLIRIEGQTVPARRLLGESEAVLHQSEFSRRNHASLGLIELMDENWQEAGRQFRSSLQKDPQYLPARFNLGMTLFYEKNFVEAVGHFEEIAGELPLARLMLVRNYLELGNTYFRMAEQEALRLTQSSFDFRQEAYLLLAYLAHLKEDSTQLQKWVMATLTVDPRQTSQHARDPLYYDVTVSWPHLFQFCETIYRAHPSEKSVATLYAYCLHRSKRDHEAKKQFEKVTKGAHPPVVDAIFAYFLDRMGDASQAKVHLVQAYESQQPFAIHQNAKECLHRNDLTCAEENLTLLSLYPEYQLQTLEGRARLSLIRGQLNRALEIVDDGLLLSSRYQPLLELKEEI